MVFPFSKSLSNSSQLDYIPSCTLTRTRWVSTNEPCEAFDSYAATKVVDGQEIVLGLWEVRDINDTPGPSNIVKWMCLSYASHSTILRVSKMFDPRHVEYICHLPDILHKWHPELSHYCPSTPINLLGNEARPTRWSHSRQEAERSVGILHLQWNPHTDRLFHIPPIQYSQVEKRAKCIPVICYFECSALTHQGVEDVFQEAMRVVCKYQFSNNRWNFVNVTLTANAELKKGGSLTKKKKSFIIFWR